MFFRYKQVTGGRIGLGLSSSVPSIILIDVDKKGVPADGPVRLNIQEAHQFAHFILTLCGEISTSSGLNEGVGE